MSDVIVGIAVLDKTEMPEYLHVLCQTGAGKRMGCGIPVYPRGQPKTRKEQWQYDVVGTRLDVTPSLNWIGVFHNSGSWSVEFVPFDKAQFHYAGDQFRSVNGLDQGEK